MHALSYSISAIFRATFYITSCVTAQPCRRPFRSPDLYKIASLFDCLPGNSRGNPTFHDMSHATMCLADAFAKASLEDGVYINLTVAVTDVEQERGRGDAVVSRSGCDLDVILVHVQCAL